jgi:hypothetical protein
MVMVTGADCMIAPDVPVTVKVTWDAAGWDALDELPHPTAHSEISETTSSNPNTPMDRPRLRVSGFRLRVVKTVQKSPKAGSTPPKTAAW